MRVATGTLVLATALACTPEPAAPEPAPEPHEPDDARARWDGRIQPPPGFGVMDAELRATLRAGSLQGTASAVEVQGWTDPGGATVGFVSATDVEHDAGPAAYGHTLTTWMTHELGRIEGELDAFGERPGAPKTTPHGNALDVRYAVPLPDGTQIQVWGRAWLDARGALQQTLCHCAGSGCTTPPACRVATPPADALSPETVLGEGSPHTLRTALGDAQLQAPPHLTPLDAAVLATLSSAGAEQAPQRTDRHVQGLRGGDGSGVFLNDATWCAERACDAQTVADNRRAAELKALRSSGAVRSVQTRSDPNAPIPTYGYEILQRDGFWTRTTFYNRGKAVREVSCACAGMACALVRRTCTVTPK